MTLLILSDSHSKVDNMVRAVEQTLPDRIIHLGDCWRDGQALRLRFPDLPMEQVPGNCDPPLDVPAEKLLTLEGKRILLCHGHTYGVKESLLSAGYAAQEQSADLFLFGHTHRPLRDFRGKTDFLNPGSIGDPLHPTYGVVWIQNGTLQTALFSLR